MRKLFTLLTVVLLLAVTVGVLPPTPPSVAQDDDNAPTIAELVTARAEDEDNPQFTLLLEAIRASEASVLETLADDDATLTVFAPTDAAFELLTLELGRRPAEEAFANPDVAASIMLYHVLPFELGSTELATLLDANDGFATVPTAQGQYLDVAATVAPEDDAPGIQIDGQATIQLELVDIPAANGVVHVIDAVLLPEAGTVTEVLQFNYANAEPAEFTALLGAVESADPAIATYLGALENDFTLFAPVDAAFADVELPDDVTSVLHYHVVSERLGSAAIRERLDAADTDTITVETLTGETLTLGFSDAGALVVNGTVAVLASDIDAVNGVIHAVGGVLD